MSRVSRRQLYVLEARTNKTTVSYILRVAHSPAPHTMESTSRLQKRFRYPTILLGAMVSTDFKLRYQASVLGYLWTLLRPLALFTILYVVFVQLLKIGAEIPYNAIYLLFGIVIWGFFSEVSIQGLGSLVSRADLLRKIRFPRYVVVVSVGVSALISFGLSMAVILVFMAFARVPIRSDVRGCRSCSSSSQRSPWPSPSSSAHCTCGTGT